MPSSSGAIAAQAERSSDAEHWLDVRWVRVDILLAGAVALQFALYWPSLVGGKVLLPLELLTTPGIYLPPTIAGSAGGSLDNTRLDLVLQFEPERQFAARELAAHRWPRWLPYEYGGVPMRFTVLSPLFLLKASTTGPRALAWSQLLIALIAASGAYRFFRDALRVPFWPSAAGAWAYSLTGFFVLWQGFPLADTICWFPWLLAAVHATVEGRRGASLGVAFFTAMELVSGQLDVGALAIGTAAAYGFALVFMPVGWLVTRHDPTAWTAARGDSVRPRSKSRWQGVSALLAIGVGVLLAAPYVLPYIEYARTGERIGQRAQGQREERPPEGAAAALLLVWPDLHGTSRGGSVFFGNGNQVESAAAGYAGTFTALFLAPLAWCSRRHRRFNVLCALAILLGVGWCVNLPGWVSLLRMPPLNLLSFNRLVFLVGFALVAQAVIGLHALFSGEARAPRRWLAVPLLAASSVLAFAVWRAHALPEPLATEFGKAIAQGRGVGWLQTPADLARAQAAFVRSANGVVAASGLAVIGWLAVLLFGTTPRWLAHVAWIVAVAELYGFARGRVTQSDPSLYYPRLASLEPLRHDSASRVVGFFCLPANVAPMLGLNDVRGYDPVEPARMTELVRLAAHPQSPALSYTAMQWFAPAIAGDVLGRPQLPPVLNLLAVKYVICRGDPPGGMPVDFAGDDYWGVKNSRALPRAFVPTHVTLESDAAARLRRLGSATFDPKVDAFVETAVTLPANCAGDAHIRLDEPTHVQVTVEAATPALLVLADRWDAGWRAYVNRREQPILQTDHAVRGVIVPAGNSVVDFEYAPVSERIGWWCAAVAVAVLSVLSLKRRPRRSPS